ncbi:MAG: hemerythrin domain-containing protein [Casimicrobiaceae bacterium]
MDVIERVRTTLGAYTETDVRALLQADHKEILRLTQALAEATTEARRRSLLNELKPLVVAHARSEEHSVYVPMTELRRSPDARLCASEGAVEHSLVDIVLGRLAATADASTDMWKAHAKVLHESLSHHINEEEGTLFEEVGEQFSEAERTTMGERYLRHRADVMQREIAAAN